MLQLSFCFEQSKQAPVITRAKSFYEKDAGLQDCKGRLDSCRGSSLYSQVGVQMQHVACFQWLVPCVFLYRLIHLCCNFYGNTWLYEEKDVCIDLLGTKLQQDVDNHLKFQLSPIWLKYNAQEYFRSKVQNYNLECSKRYVGGICISLNAHTDLFLKLFKVLAQFLGLTGLSILAQKEDTVISSAQSLCGQKLSLIAVSICCSVHLLLTL